MSRRKKKKSNKQLIISIVVAIIIFILICIGSGVSNLNEAAEAISNTAAAISESILGTWQDDEKEKDIPFKTVEGSLKMHTIDVGQGDSCLIIQGENTCLIDCGTKAKGKDVVGYLKDLGITKIDILIGTHPHDDHMGGMAEVINSFEIGVVYTPNNGNDNITTTWYMDFLNAVDEKNVKWEYPKVGEILKIGEADLQFLAPNASSYTNNNNYSIATKIVFGNTKILLTGDAEELAENEMLNNGYNIEADVFKAAHHGSDTSNTKEFLQAVNPKYVIISCKTGNTYGHPKKKTMELFQEMKLNVYRTDESGSIIMTTNRKGDKF